MNELYISKTLTPLHGFTHGIEGPACDSKGNLYAVNYAASILLDVSPRMANAVFTSNFLTVASATVFALIKPEKC